MRSHLALLALLAAVVVGCVSAEGAYTDGMALETSGDYAGAADAYATALERDARLPNVAGRLAVAGREAVRQSVTRAGALEPEAAAQAYLDADALIQRAARLGVDLERPRSFEADRDAVLDAAVAALLDDAEADRLAGDHAAAMRWLTRAQAFRPRPDRRTRLDALARGVYGDWAEADLDAGRYRDGLAHAEAALALAPDGDLADRLLTLRDDLIAAGTVVVAVFPIEGGDGVTTRFLRDLGDMLVEERLAPPPLFVALVDPADVRRWDRDQGRRRPALSDSPRRLGRAAADLGADIGVVAVLAPLREQEVVGEARTESADIRRGSGRRPYTIRPITLTLSVEVSVVAVRTDEDRPLCDRTVTERVRQSYDVATTTGDWRDLDLSRSKRAAFADGAADRAVERALDDLRDALATTLAEEVGRCLQAQVR